MLEITSKRMHAVPRTRRTAQPTRSHAHSYPTNSKPCIAPGNALHLIDDDPAPRRVTPASIIILPSPSPSPLSLGSSSELSPETFPFPFPACDHDHEHDCDCDYECEYGCEHQHHPKRTPADGRAVYPDSVNDSTTYHDVLPNDNENTADAPRPSRVRFRSRVRITSGLRSTCSSRSSSVSAPLRRDEAGVWGPLGRRISALRRGPGAGLAAGTVNGNGNANINSLSNGLGWDEDAGTDDAGMGRGRGSMDERAPLMGAARARGQRRGRGRAQAYGYGRGYGYGAYGIGEDEVRDEDGDVSYDSEQESRRLVAAQEQEQVLREEQAVFGPWPWRVFNRHVSVSVMLVYPWRAYVSLCLRSGGGGRSSRWSAAVAQTSQITMSNVFDGFYV